ncbi:MAG: hypothetical protein M1570_09630 [Chloroflexi bacterium]|nr:hypothetical protein [Chloroflexota bacterium]
MTEEATETSNAPVPNQAGARDILVFRGAEYWPTPEDVIREVHAQGLSVRIPRSNIPEGMVKGLSRIALAHIKAVMVIEKGTVEELRTAFESLHDNGVDRVLARKYEQAPSQWLEIPESPAKRDILERLGVSFKPGIFAFCYWTSTSYYLKPDENDAPQDLAKKGIMAVRAVQATTGEVITGDMDDAEVNEEDDAEGHANG